MLCETADRLAAVWHDMETSGTVTEGIAAAEEAWRGGIADLGDRQSASMIQQMPDYTAYAEALRASLATRIGFPLTVYRAMPEDAVEEFMASPYSTEWATSLQARTAEGFARAAAHRTKSSMVLLRITVRDPAAIIMRGKFEEAELVIATWEVADDMIIVKSLNNHHGT